MQPSAKSAEATAYVAVVMSLEERLTSEIVRNVWFVEILFAAMSLFTARKPLARDVENDCRNEKFVCLGRARRWKREAMTGDRACRKLQIMRANGKQEVARAWQRGKEGPCEKFSLLTDRESVSECQRFSVKPDICESKQPKQ